jgi:hypothetical protein
LESPARSHGPRPGTTGTVTVAELLARCAAVGLAPPRSGRKVAVAAGALFAATAVFGPSVVQESGAPSITGRGTALPLPPTDAPLSADYDWFNDAASVSREKMVFAAMRQVFAEGIPSEVGSTTYDRLVTEPSAGGQHSAVRRVQTPDRASTGSTDPSVAPESGTVPPGGAGTPPGGIWSPPPSPERSDPGGGPPAGARPHGNGQANGHSAEKPGNGPPSSTPAAAKSEDGRRNGPPDDTPGNGPPSSTPASTKAAGGGRGADRSAAAAGEHRGDPQRKGAQSPDPPARKTEEAGSERSARDNGSSREKNSHSRAASDDGGSDDSGKKGNRASRERSADKSDESSGRSDSRKSGNDKSHKDDSDEGKGSDKGSDKPSGKGGGKGGDKGGDKGGRSADD